MNNTVKTKRGRIRKSKDDIIVDIVKTVILLTVVIVTIYPFWNIFIVSINDATDAIRGKLYFWPRQFSLASYANIFKRSEFLSSIKVSVARTVIGAPFAVMLTTMLAYVLSRKDLIGKKFITLIFIFTMYFGGGLVPYYMVLKNLNLLNNFLVFILPNAISVYNMILVKSYIESMPEEIFESSKLDGANDLTIFFRMVLPLSKPIIMTIGLFVAVTQWNSWFDAYLYTSSQSLKPMQSILVEILNQYQTGESVSAQMSQAASGNSITPDSIRMAATMVSSIPIIIVYPFVQKYFVKGIMLGAVKS